VDIPPLIFCPCKIEN